MINPIDGFVVIEPQTEDDFFTLQETKTLLRTGKVIATGGQIYHVSGVALPCPVNVNDTVVFQYVENQDYTDPKTGKKYYIVSYNSIAGKYASK